MRYNNSMGFTRIFPLSLCAVAFLTIGCASRPSTKVRSEWEKRNQELERQVTENEAEVKRLQKLLTPEIEVPDFGDDAPSIPVATLKPPRPEPAESDDESEAFPERGNWIATSAHEAMTWYQQGAALLEQEKYDLAVASFTRFLKADPEHVYADRAQYWIGEAYLRNREYGLAVIAFNRVASLYPQSVKVPQAMYQAAIAHLAMGQTKPARVLLRDVLRQFPSNGIANPASRKLAEISARSKNG